MKLFHLYLLFALLGICSYSAIASDTPYITFTKFKNEALAAVSMTFDDALPSHITKAIPILNKYDLHATFFVFTDNVKPTGVSTWDAWKQAVADGHEVGGHTKTHPALTKLKNPRRIRDEIEGCADLIEKNLGVRPLSFAYPFSDVNDVIRKKVQKVYFIDRGSCRMWGGDKFTAQEGIRNIDKAVVEGDWFYCMMHGIDDDSFLSIKESQLLKISEYLAKNRDKIWTDTYTNVGLYERERIVTEIKFKDIRHGGFMMRLDVPDDVRFREYMVIPLTLNISLDGRDEAYVKIYDDNRALSTHISRDGKGLLVDVVPNGKWIQVYWGK